MGKPGLTGAVSFALDGEAAFKRLAGAVARAWRDAESSAAVLVGLRGGLGTGKTTWVRGMLEGLGYTGRVPSPTYTLLEHYALGGLDLVHVDLYRLGGRDGTDADARGEIEALGVRDWLDRDRCWLLIEWPERSAELLARCDIVAELAPGDVPDARRVALAPRSPTGNSLLKDLATLSAPASS